MKKDNLPNNFESLDMSKNNQKIYKEGNMPSPEIASWMEYSWEMQQKTPERIEDAAKFLATMISIALAVFPGIFGKITEFAKFGFLVKLIPIIWILALILAFLVLYPRRYRYSSINANSIKEMTKKITKQKQKLFTISIILFISAFVLFVWFICKL